MNYRKPGNDDLIPTSSKSVNYQEASTKELRKINDNDRFPCFSCFDQPGERLNCTVCNKMGYVTGSHPMVKFVDDFLAQNLVSHLKNVSQSKESYANDSHSSDEEFLEKKNTGKRMECRSALASYQIRDSNLSEGPQPANMMKSSKPEAETVHHGFKCDECDQHPIKGIRYKCTECQDYDLCSSCYQEVEHEHRMEEIEGKQSIKHEVSEMIESLKRSTRIKR